MEKVDVIIPTYRPGAGFGELLDRLCRQERPIDRILVMNTEEEYWNREWEEKFPKLEVRHLRKQDFDHGGTRRAAAELSGADILVFMTQDALPADGKLIGELIRPLTENTGIGASYARQLPAGDCGYLERYTRSFNYPAQSSVKWEKDMAQYGIKTFFCSNVCAAYRKDAYQAAGGFVERAIFNEDMICAGNLIKKGYGIAYQAGACVIHSHNYTCLMQLRRNFDLGVSQAEHPEVFSAVSSEGEGLRLVRKTLGYLCRTGHIWLIPQLVLQSGCKYAGYFLGKRYKKLPPRIIRVLTMNAAYWKKEEKFSYGKR